MATRHQLALDVVETAAPHILKISDASVYAALLETDCHRLDIWLPGFSEPVYITEGLHKDFIKSISSLELKLQQKEDDPLRAIPDGVYKIRYSVSPNEYVFVEYNHLRTVSTLNEYYLELSKVQLEDCEPDEAQHRKLHDLRYIKQYIDAAKAKVEFAHAPQQGLEMLVYAQKLIQKFRTIGCLHC